MSKKPQEETTPTVAITDVTPEMAEAWLGKNHDRNRKLRKGKVSEYEADMRAGRWVLSDQAITFNTKGKLINGQHRLQALIRCGKTARFLVLYNCPDRSLLVIDGGMKRSTNDRFGMAGKEYPAGCGATVRRIFMGMNSFAGGSISDWQVDEFMAEHGRAVANVHRITGKHKVTYASVRAVLTLARIRGTSEERLDRFCDVLNTGLMRTGESAAVLLRNFLLKSKSAASGSGTARQELYALTQAALKAFLAGMTIKKLEPAKEDLFQLSAPVQTPSEKQK